MIFFSQKIKFKKQSETVGLNFKDKHIKKNKQELLQLSKKHNEVDDSLKKCKSNFDQQRNKLISEHRLLLAEESKRKLKILKLQILKDQLLSKQKPQITEQKGKILKKYLKCMIYTIGDRYQIIKSMGNFTTYDFMKTKVLNLQHRMYLKRKMREIVFMKKILFEEQLLMLVIKQKEGFDGLKSMKETQFSSQKSKTVKSIMNPSKFNPSTENLLKTNKSYQVKIYALTGKPFDYQKIYTQKQFAHFIDQLLNKKKSVHINNHNPHIFRQQQSRKPRLSLEFNPVFKKSLEGFFFKRSSLTASQIQNKLVNVNQWLNQAKNSQRSGKDSERSGTDNLQTSQDHTEINQTIISKTSQTESHQLSSHETNTKTYFQNYNHILGSTKVNNQQLDKSQGIIKSSQKQQNKKIDDELSENSPSVKEILDEPVSGFIRSFIYGQKVLFPDTNPLLNIVIIKSKNNFQFLPEYLENKQKFQMMMQCVKKYQLKIKLQKQVRKSLLYKIIKIQTFFQTQTEQIQPFSLDVLFSIKYAKNDIYIPKVTAVKQHLKLGKEFQTHEKLKGKPKNGFEGLSKDFKTFNSQDIVVVCQNIKCETQQNTFVINHLLKEEALIQINNRVLNMINNAGSVNNRVKDRAQHLEIKRNQGEMKSKDEKSKDQRRKMRNKNTSKEKVLKNEVLKQQQERKDLFLRQEIQAMFHSFYQNNLLSIKQYRFIRKIDYQAHMSKIIIIQKNLKCFYYRKMYRNKERFPFVFKFQFSNKILIFAILDSTSQQVKIFTECLVLRLNHKYKSYPLIFSDRYWATITGALDNLTKLSDSIVEVKDELQKYLSKRIQIYEQQQARLETLKPELYLNRLRRFFINIMLRVKVKRNIIYLKKIYNNSEIYLLIIRKSPLINTVCQANLYHLQEFYEKQKNQKDIKDHVEEKQDQTQQQKTRKTLNNIGQKKRVKYQTINLLIEYFSGIREQKIADEFYFDNEHFLLKPPRTLSIYYIERLIMVDINSQEIGKEVAMIQWKDPAKKRKNIENGSFLNLDEMTQNKLLQSFNSKSQMINSKNEMKNSKLGFERQESRMKLKRKNASIFIEDQMEKKLLLPDDKIIKRESFRITERNKCVIPRQEHSKGKDNDGKQINVKKQYPLLLNQESKSKICTNNRLSRSSLYDIFNNSLNKKAQFQIKGNGHGKFIYYSLAKVEQIFFQLRIYIVKRTFLITNQNQIISNIQIKKQTNDSLNNKKVSRKLLLGHKVNYRFLSETEVEDQKKFIKQNAFSDQLLLVHKQNINKKQLLQANWTFFYNRIAHWIKNNQHLLLFVEDPNKKI